MITSFNWRPITYTAFLLASKFWEDISIWNIDYAESLEQYSLSAIMKLESAFLGLCHYNMFVTAEMYTKYFFAIQKRSMRDLRLSIGLHSGEELKASLIGEYTQKKNDNDEN